MKKALSIVTITLFLAAGSLLPGCGGQAAPSETPAAVSSQASDSEAPSSSSSSGEKAPPSSGAPSQAQPDASSGAAAGEVPGGYPVGKMFVTKERLAYNDGDLVLRVPRLNLETRVVGGFSPEVREKLRNGTMTRQERIDFFGNSEGDLLLKSGVVLLNSASLPDPVIPNPNVSISGHRDIEGCEFYDIHKLTTGDRIYLTYAGREYVYEWQSTTIHKANDWSVTYSGTESIVSLISCDPIGTNRNRIVAVGKLIGYNDLTPFSSAAPVPPDHLASA